MASVNSTGLVEADPASMNDMFMNEPKNAAKPGQDPEDQPDAHGDLAEHDQRREPGLGAVVEQRLDEAAVPVVGDRRPALLGDRDRVGPVPGERRAAVEPAAPVTLCQPASSQAKPTNSRIGSQTRPARELRSQEPGERRALDLDAVRVGVLARVQVQDDDQDDGEDPERRRDDG